MKNKINEFDFDSRKCMPQYGLMYPSKNGLEENKKIMLEGLRCFCMSCRLCSVGCNLINEEHNPHVFSNMMFNSRFMVIGYGPEIDDCKFGTTFVGEANKNFSEELNKNNMDQSRFYISNIIKCFVGNKIEKEREICPSIFLATEIRIIQPKLIIALGKSSFDFLCPGSEYNDRLGKITNSKYGKVYTIYHPLNIDNRKMFNRHIELLSKLIKKIS